MNFKIENVVDVENPNVISKNYGYRIGRECSINLELLKIGNSLLVCYADSYFSTSRIEDFEYNNKRLIIKTKNRIYTFVNNEV